ncbi:MAG TPA: response regulator [Trichocoleus sp.]
MAAETKRLILVVDANPDHVHTIEQALKDNSEQYELVAISNSDQALDFLHQRGSYEAASRPDLILLELNLPEKDGQTVLADIKATPSLRRIPIVILTLSDQKSDVFNTYALQGNSYVVKSSDLGQLYQLVKRIEDFWLGIVTLPVD